MPQLIRTPEQIFREEGKDIYSIRFNEEDSDDQLFPSDQENLPARKEMLAWLTENIPNAHIEFLAPSENSGFLCGYFGELRVDFSEADLATYCARWENEDGGSIDPRFQCYLWPYKKWFDKLNELTPTNKRPDAPGLTKWWDTPIGFIHHQIGMEKANGQELNTHPGNENDIWFSAVRLWPELASLDPYEITRGYTVKQKDKSWAVYYVPGGSVFNQREFSEKRQEELLSWLKLPSETKVIKDEW